MLIEEQIKKLLRTKAKIDLYRKIAANVEAEKASINQDAEHKKLEGEHPGLLKEFCEEILTFCNTNINALGNGSPVPALKPVIASGTSTPVEPDPLALKVDVTGKQVAQPMGDEPVDPLRFLIQHRHLDGKKVKFTTKDGEVTGIVRGLVVPNVKIVTDNGYEVAVPPKELTVING